MNKNVKDTQITVRVTGVLSKRIKAAAEKLGLTSAGWLRQLAIKEVENKQ